jgi:hypothetical protein
MEPSDYEDPVSPTYLCFAAITAFFQALLIPRRIRSSGSSASSPLRGSVSPRTVKSDQSV